MWDDYNDINTMQSTWDSTPAASGFGKLPDGPYVCEIIECAVRLTKSNIRVVSWDMEVKVGPHAGRRVFHTNRMENEKNIAFLKADLQNAGMTPLPARIADLPEAVRDLIGRTVRVTLRTKGEYQDSYIDGLANAMPQVAPPAFVPDGDVPF